MVDVCHLRTGSARREAGALRGADGGDGVLDLLGDVVAEGALSARQVSHG